MLFNSNKEKILFYYIPVALFSLLPLTLITGPFLSDLSIVLISLIFLLYCIIKKNFSYFNKNYFFFFLIFWIYLIISSIVNDFDRDSLRISISYIRFGIFFIAIYAFMKFNLDFVKYFFYILIFSFFILIFDGFYQFFFDENLLGWEKHKSSRVSSFFGDELILGSYLSRLWPLVFGIAFNLYKIEKKYISFIIIIFVLSEILIFLSGERTAFAYINLSAFFIILLTNKMAKLRSFILLISLGCIFILSYLKPDSKNRIVDLTIEQIQVNKNAEDEEIYDSAVYVFSKQHTHHYITAYKIFLDNKLFGAGIKSFKKKCGLTKYKVSELSCSTHPHNTYIQLLSETGLIGLTFGLACLMFFSYHICIHLFKKIKKQTYLNDFQICILSGIVLIIWPFAPTGSFFNNWISIINFTYIPFLLFSLNKKK